MKTKDIFTENFDKVYLDSIDVVNEDTGLNNFILPDITEFDKVIDLVKYAFKKVPSNALIAYANFHKYKQEEKVNQTALLFQRLSDGTVQMFRIN